MQVHQITQKLFSIIMDEHNLNVFKYSRVPQTLKV
jgi:hypothetical protein